MSAEFVALDHGVEVDWIDPVIATWENDHEWVIDNGRGLYAVEKRPGRTAITRPKEAK